MYSAIGKLPLTDVTVIVNSAPIFVYLSGYMMYGEEITRSDIMGMILSFSGVMLVTNP